jgi:CBS domain-containing protein
MEPKSGASMAQVRDVMEPDVVFLADDTPLGRAAQVLTENGISGAPVCSRSGAIVGMITKTDLAQSFGAAHAARLVREAMMPEVLAVAPDDPLERAVELMAFEGVHRVLVMDSAKRLLGILTSLDVLRELSGFPRRPRRATARAAVTR